MDKEKKVRSKEEVLLKSFPHLGTRFDTIDDVIAELGEFGYGCVLAAMEEYASQLTPSSREEEQWISVEERLPEDIDVVLVWSTTSIKPTVAYYFQNDWLYHSINNEQFWLKEEPHIQITHWMPLPSPPKKVTPK